MVHQYLWAVSDISSSEAGNSSLAALCTTLVATFKLLKQLTEQAKAQKSRLHSVSLPDDTMSLAFVHAVLKHNLGPSKIASLVKTLRDMRSQIQTSLKRLDDAFQHAWNLYLAFSHCLPRVPTKESTFSTSTRLTARIKLANWIAYCEETWYKSNQSNGAITVSIVSVIWSVTHSPMMVVWWNLPRNLHLRTELRLWRHSGFPTSSLEAEWITRSYLKCMF